MRKRSSVIVLLFAVASLIPLTRAEAATVAACADAVPDNISGTVVLTADLDCSATAGFEVVGNTTFKLNGFKLTGSPAAGIAINNASGRPLRVLGPGTIDGWKQAIESDGRTSLRRTTIDNIDNNVSAVVNLTHSKANVSRNTFTNNNASNNADYVVSINGVKAKVLFNTIDTTNNSLTAGISVIGNKALVKGNTVQSDDNAATTGNDGIFVLGDKTKLIGNTTNSATGHGIHVDGTKVQLKGNDSGPNIGDGIFVEGGSFRVFVKGNNLHEDQWGLEVIAPADASTRVKNNTFFGNILGDCQPVTLGC